LSSLYFARTRDIAARALDGEMMIMSTLDSTLYNLNELGTLIWQFADGSGAERHIPVGKGHPGNPMGWDDMWAKFDALVRPRLGARGDRLFALVRDFGTGGALGEIRGIVAGLAA